MNNIYDKLLKIQKELKVPKTQYSKFGEYNYRSCEDILEAAKMVVHKHGLILNLSDKVIECAGRAYIEATASLSDGEDFVVSTACAREPIEKKKFDDSQLSGMASSYARKYALNGLFCLDDTKDADSMDNSKTELVKEPTEQQKKLDGLIGWSRDQCAFLESETKDTRDMWKNNAENITRLNWLKKNLPDEYKKLNDSLEFQL